MIIVPPRNYCIDSNPVVRDEAGEPVRNEHGNYKLRHGDEEIRYHQQDPFPLYPGESIYGSVTPLQIVPVDSALRLRCIRDFKDSEGSYSAGEEWLYRGNGTYLPAVDEEVVEVIKAYTLTEK